VRVLKPGGYLFFVVPNYGSIWEGHYGIFWIPYLPKFLSKIYVRILGRKSEYINSLQFITVPKLKKYLSTMNNIEVLGFGYDIWKNRVLNADVPQWANLKLLKTFLDFAKKFKLLNLIVFFGRIWYIQTPIVLTLRKKNVSA
jgi:hypothetical protein